MKKAIVLFLLIIFMINSVSAEYVDLTLSYPKEAIYGEDVTITFEIVNNSNDRLWDGTIAIDDSFLTQYKNYIKSERNYQTNPFKFSIIEPGKSVKESFVLNFDGNTPLNRATFNVILKCGKGMCRGGCAPFYLEKTVSINLSEKRAEAKIILDKEEFEAIKGETTEIPFLLENIGDIPIQDVSVEIKGDIVSNSKVNISYIGPGVQASDKLLVSIDENISAKSLNPIVVAKFKDPNRNEGLVYKNITITIVEKEIPIESNNSMVDNVNETLEVKNSPPMLFYVLLSLSAITIISVIAFAIYWFKG